MSINSVMGIFVQAIWDHIAGSIGLVIYSEFIERADLNKDVRNS